MRDLLKLIDDELRCEHGNDPILCGECDGGGHVTTILRTWTLQLPYETLPLSLNDRRHRMVTWRAQHNLRNQVRLLARQQNIPRLDRIHVQLHYRPITVRTRDQDNAVATLKPAIDGLRDYPARYRDGHLIEAAWTGIVPDDTPAHVTWEPPTIHDAEPARTRPQPPRLWLVITEVPDA